MRSGQCAAPALCCLMLAAPHGRSASQQLRAATHEIMKWTAGYISPVSDADSPKEQQMGDRMIDS